MQQSDAERAAHARAVKQRIQELHEHLGVRFPIYVLFTKCDLLAGFVEFFSDLSREQPEQVWYLVHYVLHLADQRRRKVQFAYEPVRLPTSESEEQTDPAAGDDDGREKGG